MRSCPCYPFSSKTRNISLLPLWTVSAHEAPLPVPVRCIPKQEQESLCSWPILSLPCSGLFLVRWQCAETGPFCKSCLSVKSFSLVLLGPYSSIYAEQTPLGGVFKKNYVFTKNSNTSDFYDIFIYIVNENFLKITCFRIFGKTLYFFNSTLIWV